MFLEIGFRKFKINSVKKSLLVFNGELVQLKLEAVFVWSNIGTYFNTSSFVWLHWLDDY